jgi:hypothetical protein
VVCNGVQGWPCMWERAYCEWLILMLLLGDWEGEFNILVLLCLYQGEVWAFVGCRVVGVL